MFFQDLPDLDHEGFAAGEFSLHEIDIHVQVFVIELVDYFLPDHGAELFEINHKSGFGIRFSFYRHDQLKIMAMTVLVGAWAKDLNILFFGPRRIIELVSCVEVFFAGDVDHELRI